MYGVVRRYQGEAATLQDFAQRIPGVLPELQQIQGFVSYNVVLAGDALVSLSIYQDKAGADQSTEVARRYSLERWSDLKLNPPEITEGNVTAHGAA